MKPFLAKFIFTILLSVLNCFCFAQSNTKETSNAVDSIDKIIQTKVNPKEKLELYQKAFSIALSTQNFSVPDKFSNDAVDLSVKLKDTAKTGLFLYMSGMIKQYQSNFPKSLDYFTKALKYFELANNKHQMAEAYTAMAIVHSLQGNKEICIKNYNNALDCYKSVNDTAGIIGIKNNLAGLYYNTGEEDKAIKETEELLALMGNRPMFQAQALVIKGNLASIYCSQNEYSKAKKIFNELEVQCNTNNVGSYSLANLYISISDCELTNNNINGALDYANKAYELANANSLNDLKVNVSVLLAEVYQQKGDFKNALKFNKIATLLKDSIINVEKSKQILELNTKYETEKKELQISVYEKESKIKEAELKRERLFKTSLIVGLCACILFVGFVYRAYSINKKQKKIIELSNDEISKKNILLEEKNTEILDSINYAKRIQLSMLPDLNKFSFYPNQCFVLYEPKDIVCGDFYFFNENKDSVLITAADCTGHGVPGALMTMLGMEKLEKISKEFSNPSDILRELNKGIKKSLSQNEDGSLSKDGMDVAMYHLDKKTNVLKYAGANRPLWIIKANTDEILEYKATKVAIGGFTEDNQDFDLTELQVEQGDCIYVFSDGYADLFGGEKGKKLTTKRLKELMIEIKGKPMQEQNQQLRDFMNTWKGEIAQVDDILVIGFRV